MAIANAKRYTIEHPDSGETATVVAVLPKGADLDAYLSDASKRFDWDAWAEQKASLNKVRVGQQKQVRKR